MARLPPPLAIRPCSPNFEGVESSKLCAASHYVCKAKMLQGPGRLNMERKIYGAVSQNTIRATYRSINLKVYAASRVSVEQTEQIFTTSTKVDELQKVSTYLFRTERGGQVNVSIRKKNVTFVVNIEVSSLQLHGNENRLMLIWGVYRSNSSSFLPLDSQQFAPNAKTGTTETPFIQSSLGKYALELEFEAKQTPFYLSFLLKSPLGADLSASEIRNHLKGNFCVPVGFNAGFPAPLGLSFSTDGFMNFAIFSRNAEGVVLCLYDVTTPEKPALELHLDPYVNRSGDVWHASMESACNFGSYGYRFKGDIHRGNTYKFHPESVLLDPYAKVTVTSIANGHESDLLTKYLGRLCKEPDFDWVGDVHLNLPMETLVVYWLNVMRFTEHKSSQLPSDIAGTFSGITEKVHHLKNLGINAVLLEPIFPFDEQKGPYFPCHFFSPVNLYGPSGGSISAINSMKEMVKSLHACGIEVLLEVVYTHTADGASLQGVDDLSYYYVNRIEDLEARNALSCNFPIVQEMILSSLRHWVTEFHIDGFCFTNASSLLRGFQGEYLSRPPLIEAIAFDPLLSKAKIIADFWDPYDAASKKETRFPHWKRWAEVNMKFCYNVRNFLRGEGRLSDLATRLCGSGDIFSDGRGPAYSFNFIARNSGLPLVDLVSFSGDEVASELSWNCGDEGPTNKTAVLERRLKQIRNFLFVLHVSLGVPVLNMGDECGNSSGGSPSYGDRKPFDWNTLATGFGTQTTQFIAFLSLFRRERSDLLQRRTFLKEENIDWYGSDLSPPRWEDPSCKFLAMRLKADKVESQLVSESSHKEGDLYVAFNAADHSEIVFLPTPPEGMTWRQLVDTALPFPGFFSADGKPVVAQMVGLYAYEMKSYSCTLFEARNQSG